MIIILKLDEISKQRSMEIFIIFNALSIQKLKSFVSYTILHIYFLNCFKVDHLFLSLSIYFPVDFYQVIKSGIIFMM